jgi:hypothetical protein
MYMDNQALFVDFMYAVTVGATLPRLDEKVLHWRNPLLWALVFLIAVFLEDFYLYHAKVVPQLKSFPSWRGFLLAMLIIGTWYLSQTAFPSNSTLFLVSFAIFFLLKLGGGIFMRLTSYPSRIDVVFLFPAMTAFALLFVSECLSFDAHPARMIMVLAPVWLVTVAAWWIMDNRASLIPATGTAVTPKP